MIPSFVIAFRETLEAALIVGIVLSYLRKTNQIRYRPAVLVGVAAAIAASLIGAWAFTAVAGGFTGRAEEIFEGTVMLVGALLLTTMILWMMKERHIVAELQDKVADEIAHSRRFGLFALVFVAVLREGIETVIFLGTASLVSTENNLLGALVGIVTAVLLGYAIFVGAMRVNLKRFFEITGILLILFAAGLVAQGIHELQEASIIPTVIEHVWDINSPVDTDGSYPLLHENGYVGSILKGLFGYNGNPSLIEVLSYLAYLVPVLVVWRRMGRPSAARAPEAGFSPTTESA